MTRLEFTLARRYLSGKERGSTTRLLSSVALISIAIGVFALIVVQCVMSGFSHDLRERLIHFSAPIIVTPNPDIKKDSPPFPEDPRILKKSPYLETEIIVRTPDDLAQGAKLKGVDLAQPQLFEKLEIEFVEGLGPEDLKPSEENLPGILLGSELAKRLQILPILLPDLEVIYPFGDVDPSGEMRPRVRRFRVIGTFKSGYYEYDHKFVITHLGEAQRLLPQTETQETAVQWGVWTHRLADTESVAKMLQRSLGNDYQVKTWGEKNKNLLEVLQLERRVMFLILGIMIAIATFNIFTLTLMTVVDKQKEIALLKALGMESKRIHKIFSWLGCILGFLGTTLGVIFATGTVLLLNWHPVGLPPAYYLSSIPVRFEPLAIGWVMILGPGIAWFASWYPARKGGHFEIAESLKYE